MSREEREELILRQMEDAVEEYGHALTGVFDADPAYMYTVGLTKQGRPELVMAGLDLNTMAVILNQIAEIEPVLGEQYTEFTEGNYPLAIVACDPEAVPMSVPLALYGRENVRALQVVWPDRKRRFPWENRYNPKPLTQPLYPLQEEK